MSKGPRGGSPPFDKKAKKASVYFANLTPDPQESKNNDEKYNVTPPTCSSTPESQGKHWEKSHFEAEQSLRARPWIHDGSSSNLPVWEKYGEIMKAVIENQVTIIVGETGSGKTTQIPKMLYALFQHRFEKNIKNNKNSRPPVIAITQPRQVAATTLANRVRQEMADSIEKIADLVPSKNASPPVSVALPEKLSLNKLGGLVGFNVRFHKKLSRETQIKFMTDGMLLREGLIDPFFRRYRVVVIDEAHERSTRSDVLLGFLKLVLSKRSQLKIVVMSATLDFKMFQDFFNSSDSSSVNTIIIPGRQHQVTLHYAIPKINTDDYLKSMIATILQIHLNSDTQGDILAFLPGQEEIERVKTALIEKEKYLLKIFEDCSKLKCLFDFSSDVDSLDLSSDLTSKLKEILQSKKESESLHSIQLSTIEDTAVSLTSLSSEDPLLLYTKGDFCNTEPPRMSIVPLYAALSPEQQNKAFEPAEPATRKVILATNIAETSLTIPKIKYVVDCGFYKSKSFNPSTGVDSLTLKRCSRAMVNQRSGRAGREAEGGKAYRLFTEETFHEEMEVQADPEITRSNLLGVVLELKALGVEDPTKFPFLTNPSQSSLKKAVETLIKLKALELTTRKITNLGLKLTALPIDPEYGNFLLNSFDLNCTAEVLTIVALLNTDQIFINSRPSNTASFQQTSSQQGLTQHSKPFRKLTRKGILSVFGDHLTLLNIFNVWESHENDRNTQIQLCNDLGLSFRGLAKAKIIRKQLRDILLSDSVKMPSIPSCLGLYNNAAAEGSGSPEGSCSAQSSGGAVELIQRCLVKSFPSRIARLLISSEQSSKPSSSEYVLEHSRSPVLIHPSSTLFHRPSSLFVVFDSLIQTNQKVFMQHVTQIDQSWLTEYHPHLFSKT